jgi:hypothetical protein
MLRVIYDSCRMQDKWNDQVHNIEGKRIRIDNHLCFARAQKATKLIDFMCVLQDCEGFFRLSGLCEIINNNRLYIKTKDFSTAIIYYKYQEHRSCINCKEVVQAEGKFPYLNIW